MLIDLDKPPRIQGPLNWAATRFKAYHCTRAIRTDICSMGLKCFDLEQRIKYVLCVLSKHGISSTELATFYTRLREYLSGNQLSGRKDKLCLCLNRALFEVEDGCDDFFKNFGGESIYRVAQHYPELTEIKNALQTIGEPLLVTASVSLDTSLDCQKDAVTNVLSGLSTSSCEVFISVDLLGQDILAIERYEKST